MTNIPTTPDSTYQDRVSLPALQQLLTTKGEGDEWDFKVTLRSDQDSRVELAKDALALCNLAAGGTLIIGVTDDYQPRGLEPGENIDTTLVRQRVEKYIDGDFVCLAAEHELTLPGEAAFKRFGIVYFRRRAAQPVLAAMIGQDTRQRTLFQPGDIFIRRGAQSIRANSGDIRRLLTSTVVSEARVNAVRELWECLVEQRRLMSGVEFLFTILAEGEYTDVFNRPNFRAALGNLTEAQHAQRVDELQLRVIRVRPYLSDDLYARYRVCSAFVGRVHMKTIRQRDNNTFQAWTKLDDGTPDAPLLTIAQQLVSQPEIDQLWAGQPTPYGALIPLTPAIDTIERSVLEAIRPVLSGLD